MVADSQNTLLTEIREKVPEELQQNLFNDRDGAAILSQKLPEFFTPEQIAVPSVEQRAWELIGLFYFYQYKRNFDALGIFLGLYRQMLQAQEKLGVRVHKGMPLLWAGECFALSEYTVLRKRYLMLALCEDAISGKGVVAPESTGVYFRLVWRLGMPDGLLKRYGEKCYQLATQDPIKCQYPEWVLQNLDQDWMTEFPSPPEANVYVANVFYVKSLLSKLGSTEGT